MAQTVKNKKPRKPYGGKKRTHLIHNLLKEMYGGEWVKHDILQKWTSSEHDFWVYRGGKWDRKQKKAKMGYRRSDTKELIYKCNGRKP
jgi:hypothetical protein